MVLPTWVSPYANSLPCIFSIQHVAIARVVKSLRVCIMATTALATSVDVLAGKHLIIMTFIKQFITSRNIPQEQHVDAKQTRPSRSPVLRGCGYARLPTCMDGNIWYFPLSYDVGVLM